MYKALYRKWRPLVLGDVVGQQPVTDTLRQELVSNRLSHAYLFTGTRGTGKTSCAKILARAVNCEAPKNGDPCNKCPSCRGILDGSILDVVELDAASYSGVDNIRALRDESIYTPASVKMRVYIIDEVHMLSIGAFNALLTILEEPPPHVLFVLATTETHKVPATILSRCQRFAFRRIPPSDIAAHLGRVAGGEGFSLAPEAAAILTRLADGSLRDALSLLDQCMAADTPAIGPEAVYAGLGMAGLTRITELAGAVAGRDTARALSAFSALYESGRDMASLLDELCTLLRDLLLSEYLSAASLSGLDEASAGALAAQFGRKRLLFSITLLQETQALLARGGNRRVDAELCLLRLCDERLGGDLTALAARVARLESGTGTAPIPARVAPPLSSPSSPAGEDTPAGKENGPTDTEENAESAPTEPPGGSPQAMSDSEFAERFIEAAAGETSLFVRAILSRAHYTVRAHEFIVTVESFEQGQLQDQGLLDSLKKIAANLLGREVEIVVATGAPPVDTAPQRLEELIQRGAGIITVEE